MEDKEFDKLMPDEKKELFQKALENYNNGFVEEDYVVKSLATVRVEDALKIPARFWKNSSQHKERSSMKQRKQILICIIS